MSVPVVKVSIRAGSTWRYSTTLCYGDMVYKAISAVDRGWPTTITVTTHGIPAGVRIPAWIANARGPKINTTEEEPHIVERVDDNTLMLIGLNTGRDSTYTANSGTLAYIPVRNIAGWTARADFKYSVDGDTLVEALSTGLAPEIVLDGTIGKIDFELSEEQTRTLLGGGTQTVTGIAHVELVDGDGAVHAVFDFAWTATPEGTTEA